MHSHAGAWERLKKPLRHSARSEAELQNLMSKQKNKISRDLEDSATARRMTVFFEKMVDALRLSTLQINSKVRKSGRVDKRSASTA